MLNGILCNGLPLIMSHIHVLNIVLCSIFWLFGILSFTWLNTLASSNEPLGLEKLKTASYLNSTSVRLESSCRVFGGHSALDGTAIHSDLILFEV